MSRVEVPDENRVLHVRDARIAEAAANGGRATVVELAHRLGLSNTTFWRHYPQVAADLTQHARRTPSDTTSTNEHGPSDARAGATPETQLRQNNQSLREQLECRRQHRSTHTREPTVASRARRRHRRPKHCTPARVPTAKRSWTERGPPPGSPPLAAPPPNRSKPTAPPSHLKKRPSLVPTKSHRTAVKELLQRREHHPRPGAAATTGRGQPQRRPLGNSNTVKVGDPITSLGNAQGQNRNPVAAPGSVTQLNAAVDAASDDGTTEHLTGMIQGNPAAAPGDSGGPTINRTGEIIGVTTAGSNPGAGNGQQDASAGGGAAGPTVVDATPINIARAWVAEVTARTG